MSELHQQESEFSELLRELPCDDAPRPEHAAALREQVLAKFDQARVVATEARSWKHTLASWREIMRRPIPRIIAATIACLVVAAPWLFGPEHHSTAFAFNNFATALVEAKTARFQMEVKIEGLPTQKFQSYYRAPGKFRQEMALLGAGSVSISDELTGTIVMLMPATKTAIVTKSNGRPKDQPSNDPFYRLQELLSKSRGSKDNPFQPIGEKEINGKQATGFRSETAAGQFTLWGDPATGHPIRVEAVWSGTPRNETIMSDFEINPDLDESLFDLTPPADYKVQSFEVDVSKPGEQDLISAFKICGDISGGELPESLGLFGQTFFFTKHTKDRLIKASDNEKQQIMKQLATIGRGVRFALELPETANAHYAGKGVKQGSADKPIFWYKPVGSMTYRVINADLSVKDTDKSPEISGAERLHKVSPTSNPGKK